MNKSIVTTAITRLFFIFAICAAAPAVADDDDDVKFIATLTGAQEVPEVATPASGEMKARFDDGFTKVKINLRVRNLIGSLTRVHFHCARPSANGPIVFGIIDPGRLTFDGKRIRGTLTNEDFNGANCVTTSGRPVENIAALVFAMQDGLIYVNVHTDMFPAGEIRGQMRPRGHDD